MQMYANVIILLFIFEIKGYLTNIVFFVSVLYKMLLPRQDSILTMHRKKRLLMFHSIA